MKDRMLFNAGFRVVLTLTLLLLSVGVATAHCDSLDGPVVKAAQKALESGDIAHVLIWVPKKDEAEVRQVFKTTLSVRKLNSEALGVADRHFFETVVRLHRAGEGEPYTGLKPAGSETGAGILAADKALADAALEPLIRTLQDELREGLQMRYQQAMAKKNFSNDVEAGRAYVAAYVSFIHYVDALYEAAAKAEGHPHQAEKSAHE